MLDVGEDEGGFGEVADGVRAGGDVLENPPALGEQGEAAFAEGAQHAEQQVVGAAVDVKPLAGFRRQERSVNALASAGVAAVGEGGQTAGGGRVQRAERVRAGGGQVVGGAGQPVARSRSAGQAGRSAPAG